MRTAVRLLAQLAPVIAIAAASPGQARDDPVDLRAAYRVEVDVVELYPIVRQDNRYVGGLTAADFVVLDDGRAAVIDSFSNDPVPLHIALMIDCSESMRGNLRTVQRTSAELIDALGADDLLSLYAFNQGPVVAIGATADHGRVAQALAGLQPAGGTALFAAVLDVVRDLDAGGERDVVMLFSDGQDVSGMSSRRVIDAALQRGAVIDTFFAPATHLAGRARRDLFVLAERTGGTSNPISSSRRLRPVFDAILTDLRSQYSLTFSPTPGPAGKRRIEVLVPGREVRVRHRRSYRYGD